MLIDFSVTEPEQVTPDLFAYDAGVASRVAKLDGCDARLLVSSDRSKGIITVSSGISVIGQQRFALTHELGHFILHRQKQRLWACTEESFHQFYGADTEEPEANAFAAELLMPTDLFLDRCRGKLPSRDTLTHLSNEFNTSLTSTIYRFVEIGTHPCCLIISTSGKVSWFAYSNDFNYRVLDTKAPLHKNSCAGDLYCNGNELPDKPVNVDSNCWLLDPPDHCKFSLMEQSINMPRYNTILSLIWFP